MILHLKSYISQLLFLLDSSFVSSLSSLVRNNVFKVLSDWDFNLWDTLSSVLSDVQASLGFVYLIRAKLVQLTGLLRQDLKSSCMFET